MRHIDVAVEFPLVLVDDQGERSVFEDVGDLQCNLEDFDSDAEIDSVLVDAKGRKVRLKMLMMEINELRLQVGPSGCDQM